jgi:AcrR family transcriptional regulator
VPDQADRDGADLPPGLQRLWGLDHGTRRGQRPSLDIRQVLQQAVAIADADGLDAVSMHRVATQLGVTTMALYRYVESKDELLELMLEVAAGDPPPLAADLDWRDSLRAWANQLTAVYRTRPWAVDVPLTAPPRGPHQLAWVEQGLASLRATGLDPAERLLVVLLVVSYVRGEASLESQMAGAGPQPEQGYARQLRTVLDPTRFPELSAVVRAGVFDLADEPPADDPGAASFGLERILDGVEVLVRRRQAEGAGQ